MKKFLSALLAIIMLLSITACGSTTEAPAASEAPAEGSEPAPAESAEPDYSMYEVNEPVTITFWHNYSNEKRAAFLQEMCDKFHEENPLITVDLVLIGGYPVIAEQVAGALAAGGEGLPTLSTMNTPRLQPFAASEIIEPLDPYLEAYGLDRSEYYEGMMEAMTYSDGQLYGLPFGISAGCCIYNKTLLDELNLPFPETWEEFKVWCKDVTEATGKPAFGFAYDFNYLNTFFLNVTGIDPLGDGTVSALDDERVISFVKDVRELVENGYALYMGTSVNGAQEDQQAAFKIGEIAAYTDTSSGIANIMKVVDFEVGTAIGVTGTNEAPVSTVSGATLLVYADNDQLEKNAAVQFLLFLTNAENISRWSVETGMFAVRPACDLSAMYAQYPGAEGVFEHADRIVAKNPSTAMQKCMEAVAGVFGEYVKGNIAEADFDAQWANLKAEVDGMLADAAAG